MNLMKCVKILLAGNISPQIKIKEININIFDSINEKKPILGPLLVFILCDIIVMTVQNTFTSLY